MIVWWLCGGLFCILQAYCDVGVVFLVSSIPGKLDRFVRGSVRIIGILITKSLRWVHCSNCMWVVLSGRYLRVGAFSPDLMV
jgi:hypothetical protein